MKQKVKLAMIVVACCMCGLTYAQKVTIRMSNVPLSQIFADITQQTGLPISYSRPAVNPDEKVSLTADNEELSSVLNRLFENKEICYEITKRGVFLNQRNAPAVEGEKKRVSGTITDEKGEPIIGANVMLQGSSIGTITDIDGNFIIDLPADATLIVSYIGYQSQTIKVAGRTTMVIRLCEDSKALDEVVVVGYGTVKKRDLTGSVSSLKADAIAAVPTTNVVDALQGRAAGVSVSTSSWEPGANPQILIRGKRSINASNAPLFVIDGIPVTGGMGEINPADVESMEVLKDASATAIYGARGANGVVIITTK